MAWEFLASQSSQNSTDVEATGGEFTAFWERDGTSLLTTVADLEVPGVDTSNDGVKTAIEFVLKKAFVTLEYLDEAAGAGVEGANVGLGLGTRDW